MADKGGYGAAPPGQYPPPQGQYPPPQGYPPPYAGNAPPHQQQYMGQQSNSVVVVQAGGGVVGTGNCPVCRVGMISENFSVIGIILAILFFPIGLLCCFLMMEKRCSHCGATF
ncbi:brain protein I3-like [Dreissena polymorpha]|uniref:Brain protein I3 n=1 Tax=Dreissena polymorpha TaxID=45954 RepID=A0A9D4LZE8_DREPO|nr:brain protein I3-like [Dreissena polymorpha]KAH3866544.1 hypothetical protein DPMN_029621 [Dreissena polymorpha]